MSDKNAAPEGENLHFSGNLQIGQSSQGHPVQRKPIAKMTQTDLLTTDCSKCAALCCLVLAFDKGEDFAFNKNPCEPCRNLSRHSCTIHDRLLEEGFRGCVAYDCLGAGNRVIQEVFGGKSWREEPRLMRVMMEAFSGMREVHKRIDLLRAAETLPLSERDEQTRIGYLERLERKRWSGPELNDFEVDLALEIDIFFHGIRDYLPVSFFDQG